MRPWRAAVVVAALGAACATKHPAAMPALAPAATPALPLSPPSTEPSPPSTGLPPAADTDAVFHSTIKPIMASSCMPCHFPGGRMYASMPFDDPKVIASHAEGILRRIKAPEKREPLEAWLRSLPAR